MLALYQEPPRATRGPGESSALRSSLLYGCSRVCKRKTDWVHSVTLPQSACSLLCAGVHPALLVDAQAPPVHVIEAGLLHAVVERFHERLGCPVLSDLDSFCGQE